MAWTADGQGEEERQQFLGTVTTGDTLPVPLLCDGTALVLLSGVGPLAAVHRVLGKSRSLQLTGRPVPCPLELLTRMSLVGNAQSMYAKGVSESHPPGDA